MSRAVVWAITCACVLVSNGSCATSRASDLHVKDERAVARFHWLATELDTFRSLRSGDVRTALTASLRIDPTGGLELRMHEALVAGDYVFPHGTEDGYRVDHARLLVRRGEFSRARQRLLPVVDPHEILAIRVDRAFDALRVEAAFERRLDVPAAAMAAVARARAALAARPRELRPVVHLANVLQRQGRAVEAITAIDGVLAGARESGWRWKFDDLGETARWLLDVRGHLLYELDRPVEARAVFRRLISLDERGHPNVSQVINDASLLEEEGRPAEAIDVLRRVGRMSPYGSMWAASVRACAAEQLGDAAALQEAVSYLRAHERFNFSALARALLCANDLDGAAAHYVGRLGNPVEQTRALLALQIYTKPPPRRVRMLRERLARVRERADVRAAIQAVGRIEEVPLREAEW